ncbi:MAG TPA: hypothetical protein VK735_08420 [Pseudonocardia sp.]|uniref:hypothetical protein n=1 Tax=Pseudonocardia sp. TaxID=60912 RepID=UPI002D13B7C1|nr:hypothetical protein [Pseudonocardia sp.]HTF47455.1 hypothetical protein [Pseudonocardia sp.]
MTDQRLAGLSHQELWNLAHGGNPAAASTSQAALARAARVLENISRTLSAPLNEFGLGWRGQAANAARAGIGQHAGWAEAAAARASNAANQAGQQAASARRVIAEMPPPTPAPPAGAANWAKAEEASANARLRAVELMQGHATECAQTRPSAAFGRPPAAGSPGTIGATTGTVTGAGAGARTAGRGAPNVPATNPAAAERVAPSGGGASRAVRWAGLAEPAIGVAAGPAAGGIGTRPAAVQPARSGPSGPVPGFIPTGVVEAEPGRAARFPVPSFGETWPGVQAGALGAAPGRQAAPPHALLPRPEAARDGLATRGQRGADGAGPLAPRGGPELIVPGPLGPEPAGSRGHTHPSTGPAHAGVDPSMLPLLPGGLGVAESERDGHRRLGYLLDEDDVFGENEWVTPPVIGS